MLAIVEDFGLDDSHIVKEEWKSVARIIDRFSMRILKLYKTPIAALYVTTCDVCPIVPLA